MTRKRLLTSHEDLCSMKLVITHEKENFKKTTYGARIWTGYTWPWTVSSCRSVEHYNEPSGSITGREFPA